MRKNQKEQLEERKHKLNLLVYKITSKKAFLWVCLFLLLLPPLKANSQLTLFSAKATTQYQSLLSGDLESITNPATAEEHYLYIYQTTLNLLLIENIKEDDFDEAFQNALESFEDTEKSERVNYFESETRLLASLAFLKFDRQIDAAWQLRQAYKIAHKNYNDDVGFIPSLKTLSLLEILIGSVPEKYQWLLSLAGLHGSIQNGEKNLEAVINKDNTLSHETRLLYALAQVFILDNSSSPNSYLNNLQTNNPLVRLVKTTIWSKTNQGQKIIDLSKEKQEKDFPQMYYLIGDAYLQSGKYGNAISYLNNFLETFQGHSNRKDAFFKIYLAHLFINVDKANEYKMKAMNIESKSASDKNAEKLLQTDINIGIMKMRLATDGGFYSIALSQTDSILLKSKKDSVEFVYRLARLNHKTYQLNNAITGYLTTINKSGKEHWYFAPNSALQLGHIYENQGEMDSSIMYYKMAMQYKNHIYKNSIDAKCEAGINRVEALLDD